VKHAPSGVSSEAAVGYRHSMDSAWFVCIAVAVVAALTTGFIRSRG
jgi:hypothetical protein